MKLCSDDVMNAYTAEYLGHNILVKKSSDKTKVGVSGIVLDETKNTFVIKTNEQSKKEGIKNIPKKGSEFEIEIDNVKYLISGEKILIRPEDRVKIKN